MSAGELTAHAEERHPWDWYVDETWCSEALVKALGLDAFAGQWIHDPCCGRGTIPQFFDLMGFDVSGSDVADRRGAYDFVRGHWPFEICDFLRDEIDGFEVPASIVFNPPYSLQDGRIFRGLTAVLVAKAIRLASHKVCALVPSKWLASKQRYQLFSRHMPAHIVHLMERPSMPPGHLIADMGSRAFTGGKADYCWVIFDNQIVVRPGETRTHFAPPRDADQKRLERGR